MDYTNIAQRAQQVKAQTEKLQQNQQSDVNTFRGYNMTVATYTGPKQVEVVDDCFAFMFTNIGDTIAFVNGMVVFPSSTPATSLGDSRSVSGHLMDLYKGKITVAFDAIAPGTNPNLEIVQLFYVNPYRKQQRTQQ